MKKDSYYCQILIVKFLMIVTYYFSTFYTNHIYSSNPYKKILILVKYYRLILRIYICIYIYNIFVYHYNKIILISGI